MKQGRSLKEAKAERAAKKRRAKRRRRAIVLIIEILVLFVLLGIGYILTKYGELQLNLFEDGEIHFNIGAKQEDYKTIALFGGDSREGELDAGTHADTIMIVSIDNKTKEVKVLSVYRDLMTKHMDGKIRKANSAYFLGGPKEAINMLNLNFDLDIEDYVTVDFKAMADAVDLLGGVEVEVTEAEANEMNKYIGETAQVTEKEAKTISAGVQTLDGVQTVTYARIRKNVGGDYARTRRQRIVIQKVVEKVKKTDVSTLNEIVNAAFSQVSTSFTLPEIISLTTGVLQYKLGETDGFPFDKTDGYVDGIGSVVVPLGVSENVGKMHEYLYPKSEYEVSETVREIGQEIETLAGYSDENTDSKNLPTQ